MRWVVRRDVYAESFEVGYANGIGVAAGDNRPSPNEQLGESTHPRAGYADEVNWS